MNGRPLDDTFARKIGYVESQDVHLHEFTVRETLRFSAQLRQPQSVSDGAKNEYVEEVIEMLDMKSFADAVVGVPGSGLSLEQRKRMTVSKIGVAWMESARANVKQVGVELVAKPLILFLDEPTSGLDSRESLSKFANPLFSFSTKLIYGSRIIIRNNQVSAQASRYWTGNTMHHPSTQRRSFRTIRQIGIAAEGRSQSLLWRHRHQ